MSVEDNNHFRFVPTLKHMATAKIIGTVLTSPQHKETIKEAVWCEMASRYMMAEFEMKVNTLPLPNELKPDLKSFLVSMVMNVTDWLVCVAGNTPLPLKKQYWSETIDDLMSHLKWDYLGYVDGRKTLESYVSNRETIDFVIWNQLCFYCMKDEIIRFSKTMNWKRCTQNFASIFPIYWYKKIYGTLPSKKMYQRPVYENLYMKGTFHEILDEREILSSMLLHHELLVPKSGKTVSAIRYFRNCLNDDGKFTELAACANFSEVTDDVILYLLRSTQGDAVINTITSHNDGINVIGSLVQLPFILFIDDWIGVFETLDAACFIAFFQSIGAIEQRITVDRRRTLYEPFEKVWRIFYRRFNLDRDMMGLSVTHIYEKTDVILCKLMLEELKDHQRILLIKDLKDFVDTAGCAVNKSFSLQFSERVLKNDEEGLLFSEIPKFEYSVVN